METPLTSETNEQLAKKHASWLSLTDLAAEKLGGQVLFATDEFFAPASWLLKDGRGEFYPGKFTENGQYMEGWETRRHNPDHDWCIIRLGLSGVVKGFDIDTNHFTGNYAVEAMVEGVCIDEEVSLAKLKEAKWSPILAKSKLRGGTPDAGHNYFPIDNSQRWTHLKFHIYPDGGVARFRVFGNVVPNWELYDKDEVLNLLGIEFGAQAILSSNQYFSHMDHMIMPGRGKNMGDGWETKRRRGPGYDWCILKLGSPGIFKRIIVDTNHFKGNFPDSCSLEACLLEENEDPKDTKKWVEVIPKSALSAHKEHLFANFNESVTGPFNYVRLNIYPDGGVSRLRIFARRYFPSK